MTRSFAAGLSRRSLLAGALALVPSPPVLSAEGGAGGRDVSANDVGDVLHGEELQRIERSADAALRAMRLTVALGAPYRFPVTLRAAGIGDLEPQQVVRLRALVDAGILRTKPGEAGTMSIVETEHGLDYDPASGVFRSVGRRLVQVLDARTNDGPDSCLCVVTSVPEWPGSKAPKWAETLFASGAFPEFDGPGARQDSLLFARSAGAWRLTHATVPGFARPRSKPLA